MFQRFKSNTRYTDLGILLLGNILFYGIVILVFPSFLGDDYVIFDLIQSNKYIPIALDSNTPFFLFTRPLTYVMFWILYLLCHTNALLMKGIILIIHLGFVGLLYHFLHRLNTIFSANILRANIILLCFVLSLHPDALLWVDWISNVNELLVLFFYVLALYQFLTFAFTKNCNAINLFLILFFFVLSTLVKQQGIHYPVLLVFFTAVFSEVIESQKRKQLYIIAGIGFILVSIQTLLNYSIYIENKDILSIGDLYKKPFAIVGTSLYIIFPLIGNDLYSFFIVNRSLAYVSFGAMVVSLSVLLYKIKSNRKPILLTALFAIIIFFPRMSAPGGERLNSIQLFWFIIFLFFIGKNYLRSQYIYILITLVLLNAFGNIKVLQRQISDEEYTFRMNTNLLSLQMEYQRPLYILFSSVYLSWPQQFYFIRYKEFGNGDGIYFSGIQARSVVKDFAITSSIICSTAHDTVKIRSLDIHHNALHISWHNASSIITAKIKSPLRGFEEVKFKIPDSILALKPLVVYPKGNEWILIDSIKK